MDEDPREKKRKNSSRRNNGERKKTETQREKIEEKPVTIVDKIEGVRKPLNSLI